MQVQRIPFCAACFRSHHLKSEYEHLISSLHDLMFCGEKLPGGPSRAAPGIKCFRAEHWQPTSGAEQGHKQLGNWAVQRKVWPSCLLETFAIAVQLFNIQTAFTVRRLLFPFHSSSLEKHDNSNNRLYLKCFCYVYCYC